RTTAAVRSRSLRRRRSECHLACAAIGPAGLKASVSPPGVERGRRLPSTLRESAGTPSARHGSPISRRRVVANSLPATQGSVEHPAIQHVKLDYRICWPGRWSPSFHRRCPTAVVDRRRFRCALVANSHIPPDDPKPTLRALACRQSHTSLARVLAPRHPSSVLSTSQ